MSDITWDDIALEFNKVTEAFERCIKAFESLGESYKELIDYEHTLQTRMARFWKVEDPSL